MTKVTTVESLGEERHPPQSQHTEAPEDVQERAYYRYVDRGRIDGFDRDDWYAAETELRADKRPGVGDGGTFART